MTPSEILMKHEDANEYHFHEVDRKWIIEAMEEYATSPQTEISDEEIEKAAAHHEPMITRRAWISACKWYREQLKIK
jgi:hypothetical protein